MPIAQNQIDLHRSQPQCVACLFIYIRFYEFCELRRNENGEAWKRNMR